MIRRPQRSTLSSSSAASDVYKRQVDFTLRKDATTQPPHYIVIFKAKDADNMEQAFKEFTAKKLQREERPSIRKNIAASKEKAAARNADRAKEKFKERGLSPVSYTHLRAHETDSYLVCRLLLEKKKKKRTV